MTVALKTADASSVSVIIPVLNDADQLRRNLPHVMQGQPAEVIVVDGDSEDASRRVALDCGATVIRSAAGRGRQMNAGVAASRSEYICFLHADTTPPDGYVQELVRLLAQPRACLGAFRFALDDDATRFRALEQGVALRCRLAQLPYGDQGLFMRRRFFLARGGFSTSPMEDLRFVWESRNWGRVVISQLRATTSARRWRRDGLCRVTARNTWALVRFLTSHRREQVVRTRGVRSLIEPGRPNNNRPQVTTTAVHPRCYTLHHMDQQICDKVPVRWGALKRC